MGQSVEMGPTVALLSFVVVLVVGQPAGQKPCCESKEVGGVKYMLTGTMDTKAYGCITNCLYETKAKPDMKFCFAPGDLEVECLDDGSSKPPKDDSTKPPKEEASKPPMEGSSKPPMEGSSKPPMDGSSKSPMEGSSKPPMESSSEKPGGDPSTGGPTKDYTPIFTCKGTASTQSTGNQDETKIVRRDNSGTVIKEAVVKCNPSSAQSDITSSGSETESKVYCCPDCPPLPTMNMDFPTFDFGN